MTLKERIAQILKKFGRPATVKEISEQIPDKPASTVRGRIYDNLDSTFEKIDRGVYWLKEGVLLINGDGRDLSIFESGSIDAICTDHPWLSKSNVGGNRSFADYNCFHYTLEDFKEKARVLKDGGFLVEALPLESAENFHYLYDIRRMAEQAGFHFYCKVPWIMGNFVINCGRHSKNSLDLVFFTKGPARALRLDKKKMKQLGGVHYMSGAAAMLPTAFNVQAVPVKERIMQAEKPYQLWEQVLEFISLPGEVILDSFAGSGSLGIAAIKKGRCAVLIEKCKDTVQKIKDRFIKEFGLAPEKVAVYENQTEENREEDDGGLFNKQLVQMSLF